MPISDQFKKFSKDLQKSVDNAGKQALKRAATSTRAKYAKDISSELGVKSSVIKKRSKIMQSNGTNPSVVVSIGTKILLAAQEFKTAKIRIMTSKGIRIGVTYVVKSVGKLIAPAGILAKGKNSGKPIVLTKVGKGEYKTVRVDAFAESVVKNKPQLESHMRKTFISNLDSSLKYYLSKLK